MIDLAIGAIAAKQASKAKTVTQESKKGLRCDNRCGPGGPGSRLNERSMSRGPGIGEQSVLAAKLAHKAKDRAKKNRKGLRFDSSCGYGGPVTNYLWSLSTKNTGEQVGIDIMLQQRAAHTCSNKADRTIFFRWQVIVASG